MNNKTRPQKSTVDTAAFADRLNSLFTASYPPGRGPYRNSEVTQALARRGDDLSDPYLSQLRSGVRTRPSPATVHLLAEFFGVRAEYLNGGDSAYTRALERELNWLRLARNECVREVTIALLTLPPGVREVLLGSTSPLAHLGERPVDQLPGIRLDVASIDV